MEKETKQSTLFRLHSAWNHLTSTEKQQLVLGLNFKQPGVPQSYDHTNPYAEILEEDSISETSFGLDVYNGVKVKLRYQYFYYYPNIQWNLESTPDTDNYWIGLYKKGAKNTDYLAYHYIGKSTSGNHSFSYFKSEVAGNGTSEEYELRIFKNGYSQKTATSNIMYGRSYSVSTKDPVVSSLPQHQVNTETTRDPFIEAMLATADGNAPLFKSKHPNHATQEVTNCWDSLSYEEQQLVYPRLRHDLISDCKADDADNSRPEPKVLFPELGEQLVGDEDNKISLTLTLRESYTYIYPNISVETTAGGYFGWCGLYKTREDFKFDANSPISWKWCGDNQTGTAELGYIMDHLQGKIVQEYVGVVFTKKYRTDSYHQIGIAATSIGASITVSEAPLKPTRKIEFDRNTALRCAELSNLAYKTYSNIKSKLPEYNLQPELEISNYSSNTYGFIASNSEEVVIAIRGSDSFDNWLKNFYFNLTPVNLHNKTIYAHQGFVTSLNSVYNTIVAHVKPILGKKRLLITGHSRGGAVASLIAYGLAGEFPANYRQLFTFGCPPVGDMDFAESWLGSNSFVITNPGDPIADGNVLKIGSYVNLYLPATQYYLPENVGIEGHRITQYIAQLTRLPQEALLI
ncbi:lipase (class 3) [Aneurinibacillus soli]|uniref:Lipase (Class 3) n=1 Tax=Aneurinibacillus soli TaxID=1500254 RepID=A0A0U5BAM9_9BACL|nr:lipase family protein [Aneurinibacillus soli]PYE61398.1 lipase (class 3) [Aneurinibacillus soli]BAU27773.1 Lipase (class 3) [Aneurinibacillus soli]